MTISRRRPLQLGDRVRYGKYSGKRGKGYIVVDIEPISYNSHGRVVLQRCGDVPWTTPCGKTVYLNTARPGTKRLDGYQAIDVLTVLREGERV